MIKKTVIATVGALAVTFGAAYADTMPVGDSGNVNAQIVNLQKQIDQLHHQANSGSAAVKGGSGFTGSLVRTNAKVSGAMLSMQRGVNSEITLLEARKNGELTGGGLTLGGVAEGAAIWQRHSDKTTIFLNPSLTTSVGEGAANSSKIALVSLQINAIATLNSWATAYANLNTNYPGSAKVLQGGMASPGALGFRDAYILFGNLAENPLYGLIGRKDVDFGSFETVNVFSLPITRVLFQAHGNLAAVGYKGNHGFDSVITVANGGADTASAPYDIHNVPLYDNMNTDGAGKINNFALNVGYGQDSTINKGAGEAQNVSWHVGAGVLTGSQYKKYDNPTKSNGAWDLNGKVSVANIDLLGEVVSTFAKNQVNRHVTAWNIGGAYTMHTDYTKFAPKLSLSYSTETGDNSFRQYGGDSNPTLSRTNGYANAYQAVVGLSTKVLSNVTTGIEYAYNHTKSLDASGVQLQKLHWNTITLDVKATF